MLDLQCFIVTEDDKNFSSKCRVSFTVILGSFKEKKLLN